MLLLNRDNLNLYGGFHARGTHLHFDEEPVVKCSAFSLFPEIRPIPYLSYVHDFVTVLVRIQGDHYHKL